MGVNDEAYELVREKKHSLQAELPVAEVKQVLERRSEEIHDHCIVVALRAEPPHKGDSDTARQCLVDLGLVLELGVLGFDRLELDGNLLAGNDVDSEVNVTCMLDEEGDDRVMNSGGVPNEPEPIFFPRRYLPPTRRSRR